MNQIALYSPAWFENEAKQNSMLQLSRRAYELRKWFYDQYSPENLRALQGKELLTKMFFNGGEHKEHLCYVLELYPEMNKTFGSIKGGSSYKFGLFYNQNKKSWVTGSNQNPQLLSEQEAILEAERIRDDLLRGVEIIQNHGSFDSLQDYESAYENLKELRGIDKVWVLKYYQMLFPDILPVFYGKDYQNHVLKFLNITPSDIPFIRMGQINLFVKQCNIPSVIFAALYNNITHSTDKTSDDNSDQYSVLSDDAVSEPRFWLYSPGANAQKWDEFYCAGIMAIGWSDIGDLSQFSSKAVMKRALKEIYDPEKSHKMSSLATWQFSHEMKPGDIVFVKKGLFTLVGRGVVTSDYRFDDTIIDDYKNIRSVRWTHRGTWEHPGQASMKTLTDITQYTEYVEKLCSLFEIDIEDEDETPETLYPQYTGENYLQEVYTSKEDYDRLVGLLKRKKNLILQGAPGVGKTFAAKRIAYSIMGVKDPERVQMVQFHQSYSYEDFIEGYRPSGSEFILKKGAFYKFCKKAQDDDENAYFFIIDEINRGNLSKIFGELFMLIETDKRGIELQLLYSDEKFCVPKNVYIIGMMNTADRSLAMLDYALRRRFAFVSLTPDFESDGFMEYQNQLDSEPFNRLIQCVKSLNHAIAEDASLGEGFCIGHSYFCNLKPETIDTPILWDIVEYELIPLLKEYWFDEPEKVNEWCEKLRRAVR